MFLSYSKPNPSLSLVEGSPPGGDKWARLLSAWSPAIFTSWLSRALQKERAGRILPIRFPQLWPESGAQSFLYSIDQNSGTWSQLTARETTCPEGRGKKEFSGQLDSFCYPRHNGVETGPQEKACYESVICLGNTMAETKSVWRKVANDKTRK